MTEKLLFYLALLAAPPLVLGLFYGPRGHTPLESAYHLIVPAHAEPVYQAALGFGRPTGPLGSCR